MKRAICIVMLLVLICTPILVGCEDDDRIRISIGFYPDTSSSADYRMYNEWATQFESDYPEYKIVSDETYTYNPDTIAVRALKNDLPVIFQTYFTEMDTLVDNEYIRDITPMINELGWLDKMDENMRNVMVKDELCYGVPRDAYGMGLFLNLKILYDIGYIGKNADDTYKLYNDDGTPAYPTSFDDIKDISALVNQSYGGDKYGISILSANKQGGWQLVNMAWNFGSGNLQIPNSDGSWSSDLANDSMVDALSWIQDMRANDYIYPSASLNYNDWYQLIGSGQVAMAFCGSDAIANPVNNYSFDKNDIAFVPMPTGDGTSAYSLYGGTPYVFAANATDEQVEGALKFLKYIGRSPETDAISVSAMTKGFEVARQKGMPIIPSVKAWSNHEFVEIMSDLETQYCNVNMEYYKDFFATIDGMVREEEPHYCQKMYECLDSAIQAVISKYASTVPKNVLTTANTQFQTAFLDKIKK